MFKAIILALSICGPAFHVQAEPVLPRIVEVLGIPVNDTLNIRTNASGSSQDIGDLNNGDRVEVVFEKKGWGQIIHGEANGWIALRYTVPVARPTLASGLPVGLGCAGTEPFWSLNLLKLGVVYRDGGSEPLLSSGGSLNVTNAYYFTTPFTTGILRRKQCSDGMSDRTYGWQLDFVSGQGMFTGCCRLR